MFGGHGKHIAPCAEKGARSVGRNIEGGGGAADVGQPAATESKILMDANGDAHGVFAIEIESVKVPAVLEDDGLVAQGRELDVELGETCYLAGGLVGGVVHEQVHAPVLVAVGQEIDPVAVPHRKDVLRGMLGDVVRGARREIVDPDVVGLPAPIAFPGAELAEHAVVGQLAAVRRKRAPPAARQGQLLRHTAVDRRVEQLPLERVPFDPARAIDHRLIVPPGEHDVVRPHPIRHVVAGECGGVSETPWDAALGGHQVDFGVAVVLAGERYGPTVRREPREHFVTDVAGQSPGHPTVGGDREQVPGIPEHDLLPVNCREPQQARILGCPYWTGAEPTGDHAREPDRDPTRHLQS